MNASILNEAFNLPSSAGPRVSIVCHAQSTKLTNRTPVQVHTYFTNKRNTQFAIRSVFDRVHHRIINKYREKFRGLAKKKPLTTPHRLIKSVGTTPIMFSVGLNSVDAKFFISISKSFHLSKPYLFSVKNLSGNLVTYFQFL